MVRFSVTPRQLWRALRVLETKIREANWLADWWYVAGDFLWWTDRPSGSGGGSALQVDNIHCQVSVGMVALRLCMLDKAVTYDDILD